MLTGKKLVWTAMLLVVIMVLIAGCTQPATPAGEPAETETPSSVEEGTEAQERYKIGIVQIVEHPALDSAREGFIEGLKDEGFVKGIMLFLILKTPRVKWQRLSPSAKGS